MQATRNMKIFKKIFLFFLFGITLCVIIFLFIFPFQKCIISIINEKLINHNLEFSAEDIDYLFPFGIYAENAQLKHKNKQIVFFAKNISVKPVKFFFSFCNNLECIFNDFYFLSKYGKVNLGYGTVKYSNTANSLTGYLRHIVIGRQTDWDDISMTYLFGEYSPEISQSELYFDIDDISYSNFKVKQCSSNGIINFNFNAAINIFPIPEYKLKLEAKFSEEFVNMHPIFCDKLRRFRNLNPSKTIFVSIASKSKFSLNNMMINN